MSRLEVTRLRGTYDWVILKGEAVLLSYAPVVAFHIHPLARQDTVVYITRPRAPPICDVGVTFLAAPLEYVRAVQ